MDIRIVLTLLKKEVDDSLRNRWFILFAGMFTGLALLLSWLSLNSGGAGFTGFAGFGRTAASLINLVLLIVPLMALTVGAGSMAGEWEQGTLSFLLAQPVTRLEVLTGKYLGLAAAMSGALAFGFGLSGVVLALQGGQTAIGAYVWLTGLAVLLSLAMIGLGMLISVLARSGSLATGSALFLWFILVFGADLGLMGTTLAFKLPIQTLFKLALINPLQVFKMASLVSINATLDVLGPAGHYALQTYQANLIWLFLGALATWIILPLAATGVIFIRYKDL